MATQLKLRYYGDPVLRQKAVPLKSIGPVERMLIKEMIEAMYDFDGAGLAANQIGIAEQVFVADIGEGPFVVINPEILEVSAEKTVLEEGCLSFSEMRIAVERPETIRVRYVTEEGKKVECTFKGLMAKVFQHESDHLFAKMIVDYASVEEKEKYKKILSALLKQAVAKGECCE